MRKLLIITTIPESLEAFFLHFAYHFRDLGWQVDGMAKDAPCHPDCVAAFDRTWDVDLYRNPLDPRNLLSAPRQIRQVVQAEQYDLVMVSTPVAAFVGRYALRQKQQLWQRQPRVQIIYTAQGFHFYNGASGWRHRVFVGLEKLAAPWTDYLVTVNQEDAESAHRYRLCAPRKIRHIPGTGIDLNRFSRGRLSSGQIATVRSELRMAADAPLFLSLAEFIPRKRHGDLLRAFAGLARSDVHLALAGDGPLEGRLRELAYQLGIADRVHFIGFRQDVPRLIQAATATILVSDREGLPNCVMESMYLGVPVIGTNIRGTRDLLEGGCGLLVEVGDVGGLTQAMAQILDHPLEVRHLAERAHQRLGSYDRDSILAAYEALYAEALANCQVLDSTNRPLLVGDR
jgi:glycosyltransferase involved in cell wall biosynthesis